MSPPHPCTPLGTCVAPDKQCWYSPYSSMNLYSGCAIWVCALTKMQPILSCYKGSRDKPRIYFSHPLHPSLERPSCLLTPSEVQVKASLGNGICSTRHKVRMGVEEYTSTGSKDSSNLIFFKAVLSKWEMGAGEMALWSEATVNKGTCGQSW